jgi:hypothetical protein
VQPTIFFINKKGLLYTRPWADRWRTEGEALPLVGAPDGSTEKKKKLKGNAVAL